jgi:hypothetical protein
MPIQVPGLETYRHLLENNIRCNLINQWRSTAVIKPSAKPYSTSCGDEATFTSNGLQNGCDGAAPGLRAGASSAAGEARLSGRDAALPERKLLFTPGPLCTTRTVKAAMQVDMGSRDEDFVAVVKDIRTKLLQVAGVAEGGAFTTVLMQGSGTFGNEAVIGAAVPKVRIVTRAGWRS